MNSDSNFIIHGSSSSVPTRRVVLLGASNLTRGISTVVETAQKIWGEPLEIFAAMGHGRSYGMESSLLGRRLPGIVQCGLWDELGSRPSLSTAALVTDIGNDILYGVEMSEIAKWIEMALDRLSATSVSICMTGLPLAGIAELSPGRFKFFSKLFFPNCRLSLDEARRRAWQLQEALQSLAKAKNVQLIEQRGDWYGLDPIHIRLRHWRTAWPEILSAWNLGENSMRPPIRGSLGRWLYLRSRRPHHRTFFGIQQRRQQPASRFRDGTTVSFETDIAAR